MSRVRIASQPQDIVDECTEILMIRIKAIRRKINEGIELTVNEEKTVIAAYRAGLEGVHSERIGAKLTPQSIKEMSDEDLETMFNEQSALKKR